MMWFPRALPDPAPDPEIQRISADLLAAIEEDERDRAEWGRHYMEAGMLLGFDFRPPSRWRRFVNWLRGQK